jgi:hypothetical protein
MKIKQILTVATIFAALLATLSVPVAEGAQGKPARAIMLKDANGVEVGRVLGMETVSWPYVLTREGYRTLFRLGTGMIYVKASLYYESMNCTGQAYVGGRSPGTVFMPTLEDTANYTAGAIFYSPTDADAVPINSNSILIDGICQDYIASGDVFPAYPNDPAITGIENTVYPARMLIE